MPSNENDNDNDERWQQQQQQLNHGSKVNMLQCQQVQRHKVEQQPLLQTIDEQSQQQQQQDEVQQQQQLQLEQSYGMTQEGKQHCILDENENNNNNEKFNLTLCIVDHYDSYTYNLYDMVAQLCTTPPIVIKSKDDISCLLRQRQQQQGPSSSLSNSTTTTLFDGYVLSPGPGRPPCDTGISVELVKQNPNTPILGVCLGHQIIGYVYGASVTENYNDGPIHGQVHSIYVNNDSVLFHNNNNHTSSLTTTTTTTTTKRSSSLRQSLLQVTRYHSLIVEPWWNKKDKMNDDNTNNDVPLEVTAWYEEPNQQQQRQQQEHYSNHTQNDNDDDDDNTNITTTTNSNITIMALRHVNNPHYGVQFHPESIGTSDRCSFQLIHNFLHICQTYKNERQQQVQQQVQQETIQGKSNVSIVNDGSTLQKRKMIRKKAQQRRRQSNNNHGYDDDDDDTLLSSSSSSSLSKQQQQQQRVRRRMTTTTTTKAKAPKRKRRILRLHVRRVGTNESLFVSSLSLSSSSVSTHSLRRPQPSDVFTTLYANHSFAIWLDSSSSSSNNATVTSSSQQQRRRQRWNRTMLDGRNNSISSFISDDDDDDDGSRFSIMAAMDGPLSRRIEYDVDEQVVYEYDLCCSKDVIHDNNDDDDKEQRPTTTTTTTSSSSCRRHDDMDILSFLRYDMDNIVLVSNNNNNDDDDELPFAYRGGYLGFLGYEVRRDTQQRVVMHHRPLTTTTTLDKDDANCFEREQERPLSSLSDSVESNRQRHDGTNNGTKSDDKKHPSASFLFADQSLVFDHWKQEWYLVGLSEDTEEEEEEGTRPIEKWMDRVERILLTLERPSMEQGEDTYSSPTPPLHRRSRRRRPLAFVPNRSPQRYRSNIATCHEQIRRGESYELCLTNQLEANVPREQHSPLGLYVELRKRNPVPFAAYVNFQRGRTPLSICCSSPERFVSVKKQTSSSSSSSFPTAATTTTTSSSKESFVVEAKPIKGTCGRQQVVEGGGRPRTAMEWREDVQRAVELERSVKNRAENLMIVDLLRNDLNRVCQVGTVHVPKLMHIESYATVHQMVSTIRGTLQETKSCIDVLHACFPGGSMTGAPKLRSTEILHQLEEGVPRGPYSGCLGYISLDGSMDMNIVIRSAVLTPNDGNDEWTVSIGAGGAITALSDSEDEYDEMLLKARAVMEAVQAWVDNCSVLTTSEDEEDESTRFSDVANMSLSNAM